MHQSAIISKNTYFTSSFVSYGMFTSGRELSHGLLSEMTVGLANEQWATVNGVSSGFE